jgi:hypothetical protein
MTTEPYVDKNPEARPGKSNGLATSAFVCGLVGLVLSFIPVAGWFLAPPVALTGLGLGLGNLGRLRSGRSDARAFTWMGIGFGIGAIIVCIAYAVIVAVAASQPGY